MYRHTAQHNRRMGQHTRRTAQHARRTFPHILFVALFLLRINLRSACVQKGHTWIVVQNAMTAAQVKPCTPMHIADVFNVDDVAHFL